MKNAFKKIERFVYSKLYIKGYISKRTWDDKYVKVINIDDFTENLRDM